MVDENFITTPKKRLLLFSSITQAYKIWKKIGLFMDQPYGNNSSFFLRRRRNYVHLLSDNWKCYNYNFTPWRFGIHLDIVRSVIFWVHDVSVCLQCCNLICGERKENILFPHHPFGEKIERGGRWSSHLNYLST